jgi:ferredoxin
MYINPDECIDCGACEPVCPVSAVQFEEDLGPDEIDVVRITREWFGAHAEARDGASVVGCIGVDHPDIAALPRRVDT